MKKTLLPQLCLILAILFAICSPSSDSRETLPAQNGAVNDLACVIAPEYLTSLSSVARNILERSEIQIIVATFSDTGNESPETFAKRLDESWGLSRKHEDNFVLFLLSANSRHLRIETGSHLKGMLPESVLEEIGNRYARPHLDKKDFGPALLYTMSAVAREIDQHVFIPRPRATENPVNTKTEKDNSVASSKLLIAIMVLIVPFALIMFLMSKPVPGQGDFSDGYCFGGFSGGFGTFGGGGDCGFGGFGGGDSGGGGAGGDY